MSLIGFARRLLLSLGIVGAIPGLLVFAAVYGYAQKLGLSTESASQIASACGLSAGMLGLMIDAKFGISHRLHRKVWQRELSSNRSRYHDGSVSLTQALLRLVTCQYELNSSPYIFKRMFRRDASREILVDEIWLIKYVLPLVQSTTRAEQSDLDSWILILQDLRASLIRVRSQINLMNRFFLRLNPEKLASYVARDWDMRQRPSASPDQDDNPQDPSDLPRHPPLIAAPSLSFRVRQKEREADPLRRDDY
jgi:hypothetical protein